MDESTPAAVRREIAARRRAQAFALRRDGAGLDTIATRLGLTRATVQRMISQEARALAPEHAPATQRAVHVEALLGVWRALYPAAQQGDLETIDRFLRVEERLARLQGLDLGAAAEAPVTVLVGDEAAAAAEPAAPIEAEERRRGRATLTRWRAEEELLDPAATRARPAGP